VFSLPRQLQKPFRKAERLLLRGSALTGPACAAPPDKQKDRSASYQPKQTL